MQELAIVKYDITDAAIAEMNSMYMGLTINGIDDKEGFDAVHNARMVVKGKRVDVEKRRKELKADALAWGKKVDTEAKRIFGMLEPIENHLSSEENKIVKEKKRIKEEEDRKEKERIQKRINALSEFDCTMPFYEVAEWDDEKFNEVLSNAERSYRAEQDRLKAAEEARRAEEERLEKIRKEQEEKEAALAAEQSRIMAEQMKIKEEKKKLEKEKQAEQERKEREEFERQAKIQAEKEAKEKLEREAREAEIEAKRQEALKPDKEKLIDFANEILDLKGPADIKDAVALDYLNKTLQTLASAATMLKDRVSNL